MNLDSTQKRGFVPIINTIDDDVAMCKNIKANNTLIIFNSWKVIHVGTKKSDAIIFYVRSQFAMQNCPRVTVND